MYAILIENQDEEGREDIDRILSEGEEAEESGIDPLVLKQIQFDNVSKAMVSAAGGG